MIDPTPLYLVGALIAFCFVADRVAMVIVARLERRVEQERNARVR